MDAFWSFDSLTLAGLQGFNYECETLMRYVFCAPFGKRQKKACVRLSRKGYDWVCLRGCVCFGGLRSLPYAPAKAGPKCRNGK